MEKSNSLEGPIFERESRIALRGSPTLKGQEMEKCFQRGSEPNKDFQPQYLTSRGLVFPI